MKSVTPLKESDILATCLKEKEDCVLINAEVKPGSKRTEITGVNEWRECIEIAVRERAQHDYANREVIQFLSFLFSTSQNKIAIVKGERTRKKCIIIMGKTKEEILSVLKNEIEKEKSHP